MDTKDQVKQYISIVDVASMYVSLKPAGKYLKGLCPFHNEKTPSFFVMPEKNSFACYGCNRFGDIFSLVQEMENLGFPEAVNFLIERFQVPVERSATGKGRRDTDQYLEINRMVCDYFRSQLNESPEGEKARSYLGRRGILQKTIDDFSIGYAHNSWDHLKQFLSKRDVPLDKAVELGLLIKRENKRPYDRFRGRIMFPILSESGKVVAFGGRTITEDSAKYLNSPDTPVYKKSHHLYGFFQAKASVRQRDRIIVVEGYFDVVSMVQNGFPTTVASLGTALTDPQVHLLKRFSDNIHLFYDSDRAGVDATLSAIRRMFENNVVPTVIKTGEGKDPDDCLKRSGREGIEAGINNAVEGFQYLLEHMDGKHDLKNPLAKRKAVGEVAQFLQAMEDVLLRDEYAQIAADFFRIEPRHFRSGRAVSPQQNEDPLLVRPDEETFIRCLLLYPEMIPEIRPVVNEDIFNILISKNILRSIFDAYERDKRLDYTVIAKSLNDPERRLLTRIHSSRSVDDYQRKQAEEDMMSCVLSFNNTLNKTKIAEINRKIRVAERDEDHATVRKLMNLKGEFVRRKRKQV